MRLFGEITLPGDKSISHRAVMLNAIAYGQANIYNFLNSDDCLATITILKQSGVEITEKGGIINVKGKGFTGLKASPESLDCKNSGTTARMLMGLLSGLNFESRLTGDESLSKRPMKRVSQPLKSLGADIELTEDNFLPAKILPSVIHCGEIKMDVSSAQVKSAIILAALKGKEKSIIYEKEKTRNHTELMLKYLGADIKTEETKITVSGNRQLMCKDIYVPGDISSAAFFIVAALIVPDSEIIIKNCGINPTRTGILRILDEINADYEIRNKRLVCEEEVGDIFVRYRENLKPFKIEGELVPLVIDEIPVLALLATQINGTSYIRDAKELRVKETDRIKTTSVNLNKLNASVVETNDGMIIYGKSKMLGTTVDSCNDHRISMMLKVAALICSDIYIQHSDCDKISYPDFENDLHNLLK